MFISVKERISSYSHLAGAVLACTGAVLLARIARSSCDLLAVSLIYGLCAAFAFSASALYHAHKKGENEVSLWRTLDHIAIFFMIAGTYTPVSYIFLEGGWRWAILITQWSVALLGLLFKLFFLRAPRWFYTALYVIMGWVAIIPLRNFIEAMPVRVGIYALAGGIAYTMGAILYAAKRPAFKSKTFGFHELFHIFILLGAALHFFMVYTAVAGALR